MAGYEYLEDLHRFIWVVILFFLQFFFFFFVIKSLEENIYASLTLIYIYASPHALQKRKFSASVFLSWGFQNKLPLQTWWLKTTQMYSLIVIETRSPKSVCWESQSPVKSLEDKESSLVSS